MASDMQVNAFQERLTALDRTIAELGEGNLNLEQYFRVFLEQATAVLGVGGAVWRIRGGGEAFLLCHMNLTAAGLEEGGRQSGIGLAAIGRVLETSSAVVLPAFDSTNLYDAGLGKDVTNQSSNTLLFIPVIEAKAVAAVVLLISPPDVDPRAVRGFLGFIGSLCEKAGHYLQQLRIRSLEGQLLRADRWRQYVSAVHSGLSPRRSCYALANYGQELLDVFRCMAGTYSSRGRFNLEAVSGLESVAVKSNFMQQIRRIARRVCRNDRPLIVDNPNAVKSNEFSSDDLINESRAYMLEAGSLIMGVFPVRHENHVVGAMIVEKAKEEPFTEYQQKQIDAMLIEAGSALENSLKYRHSPLSLLTRTIAAGRDRLYRMGWGRRAFWGALALIIAVLPFMITKQVKVIGTAELIPVQARIAYAQQEGVIEQFDQTLFTNRHVIQGQELARMDTRLIDSQIDRTASAINEVSVALKETLQRSQTTQAQRLDAQFKALQAEHQLYVQQREQYIIRAPVDGQVITRQSDIRHLFSKPFARGEGVLEIVPDNSLWEINVNVPENEAAELLEAYDNLEKKAAKLPETYDNPERKSERLRAKVILNVCPDVEFESEVLSVAPRATVLSTGEKDYRNVIEVRLAQPPQFRERVDPRQGMEGKAAVFCGKKTLFYVLTHEFVNFIRINLF
jgi:hypothetical protein